MSVCAFLYCYFALVEPVGGSNAAEVSQLHLKQEELFSNI